MLCYDTEKQGLDYICIPDDGSIPDELIEAITQTQGTHRVIKRYEEVTHIFRYLDEILPGLRAFFVWSASRKCPHAYICEWLDQVYQLDSHYAILPHGNGSHISLHDIVELLTAKKEEALIPQRQDTSPSLPSD